MTHASLTGFGYAAYFLWVGLAEALEQKGVLAPGERQKLIGHALTALEEKLPDSPHYRAVHDAARQHLEMLF